MAVQQNKKSPSKRGMHRAHDFLDRAAAGRRADHRRNPPAPPHQPERRLSRQEGGQGQGRVIHCGKGGRMRIASGRFFIRAPEHLTHRESMDDHHRDRLHGRRPRPIVTLPAVFRILAHDIRLSRDPGRARGGAEARSSATREAPSSANCIGCRCAHASEVVGMDEAVPSAHARQEGFLDARRHRPGQGGRGRTPPSRPAIPAP
jgi:hypothetical protein